MKRLLRRMTTAVLVLAVIAALVYSFLPQPVDVDLARVARGPLVVSVDEDGKTRIKERYVVSAPLDGRLLRLELDAGDVIESGRTVLSAIEASDPELLDARQQAETAARVKARESAVRLAQQAVERLQVAVSHAENELGRTQKLVREKSASQQDLDDAEWRFRTRSHELREATFAADMARFELELARAASIRGDPGDDNSATWRFEIRAPISGRVLRLFRESSTFVTAGTPLIEIGDPLDLEMVIDVLSTDAVQIQPGDKLIVERWGGTRPLQGVVRVIEPSAFTKISALGVEEQRVNVIADFLDPPDQRPTLGDGFRIEARIVVWETSETLKVPTSALFRQNEQWAVFVAQQGRAEFRPVEIGHQNNLEAEVLRGLEDGEDVVVHPSDKVQSGKTIRPRA